MSKILYKIGIDEVGRGPVAGPVAVCGVFYNIDEKNTCSKLFLACPTCLKTKKNFCSSKCKFFHIFSKHKK